MRRLMGSGTGRRRAALAGAAALALFVGVIVVQRSGDGGGTAPTGDDPAWTPRQQELLESVEPSPSCPDADPIPVPAGADVLVDVLRVRDGCLVSESEAVAADRVDARLEALRAEPDVVAADRSVNVIPTADPAGDEPRYDDLPQWALRDLDVASVRELWPDGASVAASVIDSGIDEDHPDLRHAAWAIAPGRRIGVGATSGHGSHVAGIIAAADDGLGVEGLTPQVRLLDAQIYESIGDYSGDVEKVAPLSERIRWSVDNGAQVINMSITEDGPSETSAAAVRYALLHRVVPVAGVGNNGEARDADDPDANILYPAGYEGVVGVAAYDADGERLTRSANNTPVDLAAPGVQVMSTWRRDVDCAPEVGRPELDDQGRVAWCTDDGTSMAAPYVSATAALLKARHPTADVHQVTRSLLRSARPPSSDDDRGRFFGAGLLDPAAAAEALDRIMEDAPEEDDDAPLVAFRSDGGTKLSVFDPATGLIALLTEVDGSMGTPSHPLRWSPDGRYVAGRSGGGYVTAWDTRALDIAPSRPPAPAIEVAPGSGLGGLVVDFVFVDDTTLALLVEDGLGARDEPNGVTLHTFDLATGRLGDPVETPPLERLVGDLPDQDVTLALAGGPAATAGDSRPHELVWLDPAGRPTRSADLGHPFDEVRDVQLSPDRSKVAVSLAVPDEALSMAGEAGDPLVSLLTVDIETGDVADITPPGDTLAAFRYLRWTDDSADLVVNVARSADIPPRINPYDVLDGLLAHDGDEWLRVDDDPLLAGKTVSDRAQVILIADDAPGGAGGASGDLHLVLPQSTAPEPRDAYSDPLDAAPLATQVDGLWFGPQRCGRGRDGEGERCDQLGAA